MEKETKQQHFSYSMEITNYSAQAFIYHFCIFAEISQEDETIGNYCQL